MLRAKRGPFKEGASGLPRDDGRGVRPRFLHASGVQSGFPALPGTVPHVGRPVPGRLWPRTVRFGFLSLRRSKIGLCPS